MVARIRDVPNNASHEQKVLAQRSVKRQLEGAGPIQVTALGVGTGWPAAGIVSTDSIQVVKSQASAFQSTFQNTNNANAAAHSEVAIIVGGSSAGDPRLRWSITGAIDWTAGLDNSDSDAWVLAASGALGSNNVLRATSNGLGIIGGLGVGNVIPAAGAISAAAGISAGDSISMSKSQTSLISNTFSNTNNANAAASLEIAAIVGGGSGGDPVTRWSISGVVDWVAGLDNSDSDAWVLAASGALGSNNVIRATTTLVSLLAPVAVGGTAAAGSLQVLGIARSGVSKGFLGLDSSDRLTIQNASGVAAARVDTNGSTAYLLSVVPYARVVASGTTVHTAAALALAMTSATFDSDSMYDSTNKRLKATRAGLYQINAAVQFSGAAGGVLRQSRIQINGTTDISYETDTDPVGTFGTSAIEHSLSELYALSVNDYVTVTAYQDSGGDLTVFGNMSMYLVSPT